MNTDNLKLTVAVATSAVAVGVAVRHSIRVTKEERAKRLEIERNLHLDLQALQIASENVRRRIADGTTTYTNAFQVANDLHQEVQFQKIAIREEI